MDIYMNVIVIDTNAYAPYRIGLLLTRRRFAFIIMYVLMRGDKQIECVINTKEIIATVGGNEIPAYFSSFY